MKVVIDTNIWISYLLGSLLQGMDEKILSKEIKVVVSDEMLKDVNFPARSG
ncbi:MAG: putative toxin-antitoxin system toxin component, PIN family [Deltaproteobacteria bacterium CG12_big_fil_rev_8_21_14_0_65_43_10]|nr:MAG: putative toxin-antitoxin system toxin component, PIN family [Deltaproteobacteria bacterium CG12_big_fil_rev_8_21_14_0_65_43_10]